MGVSHAIPTRAVVAGFGEISADNRRVLVQEWLAEAVTSMLNTAPATAAADAHVIDLRMADLLPEHSGRYRRLALLALALPVSRCAGCRAQPVPGLPPGSP